MNQPDIGQKVAELRRQQNMTQEQLAEYCEVSTRTIQRIESGEVEPGPLPATVLAISWNLISARTTPKMKPSGWRRCI